MEKPELKDLSALVVDDFSSFRSTVMGMLNKIGIKKIFEASRGQEVLKVCKEQKFDLILCDYNLGAGRNGQQLLEELRFRNWIPRKTLFFMVTAEASKDMVLSAYDCEPDDYLMKPLNLKVLEQRISRTVQQRKMLTDVYQFLDKNDTQAAVTQLEELIRRPGRHNLVAQKLLGELYLQVGDWQKAEGLYQSALESRKLDWAVLGLAKVLNLKGAREDATAMLSQLIQDSRLYLPAYDELANIHQQGGDLEAVQKELQRVVELSPRSILRQRKLASIAQQNGDATAALKASAEAIRLGEKSCFKDLQDNFMFLEAAGSAIEQDGVPENMNIVDESKKCLLELTKESNLSLEEEGRAKILTARVYALENKQDDAAKLADEELQLAKETRARAKKPASQKSLARDLACYQYLNSTGQMGDASQLLGELIERYEGDASAQKVLDAYLPEPKNEENRKRVVKLNKIGITAYQQGQFDDALEHFSKAAVLFPQHMGIQLNLLQTFIGKVKKCPEDKGLQLQLSRHLKKVEQLVSDTPSQHYDRFIKLREKSMEVLR